MGQRILHNLMPLLKLILFIFFIFLCLLPFGIFLQFDFITLPKNSILTDLVTEGCLVLVVISALLMMFQVFPKLYFDDVYVVKHKSIPAFLKGCAIGFALMVICGIALYGLGNVQLTPGNISAQLIFGYFFFFLLVAIFEELMFRTFPLLLFAERYHYLFAVVINGMLFAFVHMTNPGFTWVAMINITLAGSLFSIFTLLKKNISWAIGIHFSWNFTQGILLGYQVSGNSSPGVLMAKPVGQSYISGGSFGIEGSIVCTLVLTLFIAWLLYRNATSPLQQKLNINLADEIVT